MAGTIKAKARVVGDYLLCPVELPTLPALITFRDEAYVLRDEFHVTLLALHKLSGNFLDVPVCQTDGDFFSRIRERIEHLVETTPDVEIIMSERFRLAQEDDRKSIIAMCDANASDAISDLLLEIAGVPVSRVPTHITLYTLNGCRNIGLANISELELLCEEITENELKELKGRLSI